MARTGSWLTVAVFGGFTRLAEVFGKEGSVGKFDGFGRPWPDVDLQFRYETFGGEIT
jgi:hypothetical protein